jgi:lipopolysaccharide/colanic/teichoic acid biosynthesis glycosyltransferase
MTTHAEATTRHDRVAPRDDEAWPASTESSDDLPRWGGTVYRRVKRVADLVACVVIAPFAAALMGACALAVRLDSPGRVLFCQERTGRHGRRFRMYKFRTMVHNAEELKAELAHLNILPPPDFKIPNDPRITRVGRILRKTSLDELPQLINVARGEMSLVGPRPELVEIVERYEPWQHQRHLVKPGLTGLWQVSRRGEGLMHLYTDVDLEYVATVSLRTDLAILARTIPAALGRSGT